MQQARPLDSRAARLRAELEAELARIDRVRGIVAALRAELDANPELRDDLAAELQLLVSGDTQEQREELPREAPGSAPGAGDGDEELEGDAEDREIEEVDSPGGTMTDRMVKFFVDRANRPAIVPMIAAAVGGREMSVRSILYRLDRNQGRFVRPVRHPGKRSKTLDYIG